MILKEEETRQGWSKAVQFFDKHAVLGEKPPEGDTRQTSSTNPFARSYAKSDVVPPQSRNCCFVVACLYAS